MPDLVQYFAYGSNMHSGRLRGRCPSAVPRGRACLPAHVLRFDKRSWRDGSGKCHVIAGAESESVWGVLWEIARRELPELDRAEGVGKGYAVVERLVRVPGSPAVSARTYVAEAAAVDRSLRPFAWYRDLVVAGAEEHGLPRSYVATLCSLKAIPDPDAQREREMRSLLGRSRPEGANP